VAWPTRAGQFSVYPKDGFAKRHRRTTAILMRYGFHVVELPLQAHPDIPPGGIPAGPRGVPCMPCWSGRHERLDWSSIGPDTCLIRGAPWLLRSGSGGIGRTIFPPYTESFLKAHFVLGEDLEDPAVIDSRARADRALISQRCMPPLPMAAQ
jgi:hypothetical protein